MHPILTTVCTLLPTIVLLRYFYVRDLLPQPQRTLFVQQGGGCRATFSNHRRRLGGGRAP